MKSLVSIALPSCIAISHLHVAKYREGVAILQIRWDDLKFALAVARAGAIGPAADALGVNVTTVYRRLDALEQTLGQPLFDRRQGYALTAVGHEVIEHARAVEEETLALQRAVIGHDRQASGKVRVTMPESLLELVLPLAWTFHEQYPRVEPVLETGDRMFDLQRREADVAIRPSPNPPGEALGRHVAAVGWAVYRSDEADDDAPWLAYTDTLTEVAAVSWRRGHHGNEPVVMHLSTVPAMRAALCAGRARGMLPCFVGDRCPGLRRLGAPIPEASSALWLLIHADLRRAARVRAFVDFLYPRLRALAPVFEGSG